ncbi:hypothetical protein JXA80_01150, partial [bacterium]|nr:hypothetical protein [candidate division CSSED10-310 bacterium]
MVNRQLTVIGLISAVIAAVAYGQMEIPDPTPTPEITRFHFSYNHVPPVDVLEGEDIQISVFVDEAIAGDDMRIHFRSRSQTGFHAMPLGFIPSEGRFEMAIEERYHGNDSIEYYIEIFPAGLTAIRIPETPGEYYSVKVKKRISRYLEPLLIAVLIASPAFGAYFFSKARKAHSQRRAEYERKIRTRRRQLTREREKHYREYLKTLSGGARVKPNGAPPESRLPARKGKPDAGNTAPGEPS